MIPTIQTITPNIPHRKTKAGNHDPNIQTITPNIPHRKTKAGNHDPNIQGWNDPEESKQFLHY